MPTPHDDDPPLLWTNDQRKDNVFILTARALYVATVKSKQVPELDLGLEDGEAPEDLLDDSYWKARLTRLTRFQFRRSRINPTMWLEVFADNGDGEESRKLTFAKPEDRDTFVKELNARVGAWPATPTPDSPLVVMAWYLAALAFVAVVVGGLSWLELMGWIDAGPEAMILMLDACGIWTFIVPGMVIFVAILTTAVRDILDPPALVTYAPDDEE